MISQYGLYLPLPIVAALIAFVYGMNVHHPWLSGILTFVIVLLSGWVVSSLFGISAAYGQVLGVVLSALVIFFAFTLPAQRRQARESARRDEEAEQLMNEEDL